MQPFTPGHTYVLVVGDTSVSVTVHADAPVLRLLNLGPGVVFVRIGTGPQQATPTDFPVPAGVPVLITKGVGADTVAAVAPVAAAALNDAEDEADEATEAGIVLYITTGIGL